MIDTRTLGLLVFLGLAACASVPVHYYTLVGNDSQASPSTPTTAASIEVRIRHLPPQLNRPELVVRGGGNTLIVLENERWGAPLRDELHDAIRFALQAELNQPGAPRPGSKFEVIVDIDRLDAELNHALVLEASWTSPDSVTCAVHAVEVIGNGYSAMVDGYQAAIRKLSHAIVYSFRTHQCQ